MGVRNRTPNSKKPSAVTQPPEEPLTREAAELVPDLADVMRNFGMETAKYLFKDLPEPPSPAQVEEVVLEGMLFFLHLLDRTAFERFGPLRRPVFIDAVLEGISATSPPLGLERNDFQDLWNARQEEYSAFAKLYPKDAESLKGTLCWEFAKRMGFEYGNPNPAKITLIACGSLSMIEMLRNVLSSIEC